MKRGIKLVSNGTDNHLMLLDLRDKDITGKELESRLDKVHITANKNTIPNEPLSPFITSGLRIGTAAVTTRGFDEQDMIKIAELIDLSISNFDNNLDYILSEVKSICNRHPLYN